MALSKDIWTNEAHSQGFKWGQGCALQAPHEGWLPEYSFIFSFLHARPVRDNLNAPVSLSLQIPCFGLWALCLTILTWVGWSCNHAAGHLHIGRGYRGYHNLLALRYPCPLIGIFGHGENCGRTFRSFTPPHHRGWLLRVVQTKRWTLKP